jgi:hypothetical protein
MWYIPGVYQLLGFKFKMTYQYILRLQRCVHFSCSTQGRAITSHLASVPWPGAWEWLHYRPRSFASSLAWWWPGSILKPWNSSFASHGEPASEVVWSRIILVCKSRSLWPWRYVMIHCKFQVSTSWVTGLVNHDDHRIILPEPGPVTVA